MLHKHTIMPILFGLFLTACGSDDDSTPLPIPIEYTGETEQAKITVTNAVDFVEEMFGTRGIDYINIPPEEREDFTPRPYNIEIPRALTAAIKQIDADTTLTTNDIRLIGLSECDSGYMEYTLTLDNLTKLFEGEIRFQDCESMLVKLSGMAEVSGSYSLGDITFTQITLSFALLSGSDIYMTYSASGDLDIAYDEFGSITNLIDYAVEFSNSNLTVKFDNYQIEETYSEQSMTLAGKFFHPDYGYGTVASNLLVEGVQDIAWPYEGEAILTGTESSLKVAFYYSDTYVIWVDVDGILPYDFTTALTW